LRASTCEGSGRPPWTSAHGAGGDGGVLTEGVELVGVAMLARMRVWSGETPGLASVFMRWSEKAGWA
jgi:hypothetical protein